MLPNVLDADVFIKRLNHRTIATDVTPHPDVIAMEIVVVPGVSLPVTDDDLVVTLQVALLEDISVAIEFDKLGGFSQGIVRTARCAMAHTVEPAVKLGKRMKAAV